MGRACVIPWDQEVVIFNDDIGDRYHWGMKGIDFLRTAECEIGVISWELDGCPIAGGINHHPSVNPQVSGWRALFVSPLCDSIGSVRGKGSIDIFMTVHQSGWGAFFIAQAIEAQVESVPRVADKPMEYGFLRTECRLSKNSVGVLWALVV